MPSLAPVLTPHGHLLVVADESAPELGRELARRIQKAFARGTGHGLLHLGAAEVRMALPPLLGYWREFATRYVTTLCALPEAGEGNEPPPVPVPPLDELQSLAAAAPPMVGAEYVTADVLRQLWTEIDDAFRSELAAAGTSVQGFLASKSPSWHLVGRVYFNLAENRKDAEAPFAFIATYTSRLTAAAKPQHLPLGRALSEYGGTLNRPKLLSLLLPVQRAAEQLPWLRQMVDSGHIYYPLRWSAEEALQLLSDVPRLEAAGVSVRVPSAWRGKRPPRPQVTATVGAKPPSELGTHGLLDFHIDVTLEGEPLTPAEIDALLASNGLHFMRDRWIELDRDQLAAVLDKLRAVERAKTEQGLSFAEAMRLVAGADGTADAAESPSAEWSRVVAGPWLEQTLEALSHPDAIARIDPGPALRATLRPYQHTGLRWLHRLSTLGLGACLADDMGLGKTMQVLALLLVQKQEPSARRRSLLVAPASLLANWADEIERFAPTLRAVIAHPSAMPADELRALDASRLDGVDLVITSYQTLLRTEHLSTTSWRLAIFDEAQAIKNPAAKQTRAARRLDATARIALTGTPIENRLGDLWSIFDVINPGLLGTSKEFAAFTKRLATRTHNPYAPLRALVRPYILRRLKTDRSVIADLPDKVEVNAYCLLSRLQAALYQEAVDDLARRLSETEGIERRGLVLATLMRLKQICNHPSQWLADEAWREGDSGKFARLREIVETIAARQEKVLVFTQFQSITEPLSAYLAAAFGRRGLVLHGDTPVARRRALVDRFQEDETAPYFVVSLKAGGFGLNLTAASHVVHFDRWWNPAVENQATDRAFRIGQTRNVLVHKFVCRGTVEERIDQLMEGKRKLSRDLLERAPDEEGEVLLTELPNDELLRLVALDLRSASPEA
jgi:non-specific serine/threonine protein kinase